MLSKGDEDRSSSKASKGMHGQPRQQIEPHEGAKGEHEAAPEPDQEAIEAVQGLGQLDGEESKGHQSDAPRVQASQEGRADEVRA